VGTKPIIARAAMPGSDLGIISVLLHPKDNMASKKADPDRTAFCRCRDRTDLWASGVE
jgi:hypothetical protein